MKPNKLQDYYDIGQVFVYRLVKSKFTRFSFQNSENNFKLMNKGLPTSGKGLASGSRFGSAIANLGDLQKDGLEDFAVSAPYDGADHGGAIYVYRGAIDFNFESMYDLQKDTYFDKRKIQIDDT